MRHLLIDEFQDISGQIVKWIKAVHAVLSQQGDEPSLLVVGDDWQSVYGWRGSDPEYLVDFDYRFGPSFLIAMNDNFRCGQQIINVAELLVANLRGVIAGKHGIAAGEAGQTMGGVTLCRMSDSEVHDLVKKIRGEDPEGEIFILSRTNDGLIPFRKWSKSKQVRIMTIHRAKGLQADYVVMIGDCHYDGASPLKNAIYRQAGLKTTYDAAQKEESLRLAYVGMTRARKHVYWCVNERHADGAYAYLVGADTSLEATTKNQILSPP